MRGYLSITDNSWCDFLKGSSFDTIVFWRKRLVFSALSAGEPFYFLKRTAIDGERGIAGKALFVEANSLDADSLWKRFGQQLGVKTEKEFKDKVAAIYKTNDMKLGYIVLQNPCFVDTPIPLSRSNVQFSPYTVSGKVIDEDDCTSIDKLLEKEVVHHGFR